MRCDGTEMPGVTPKLDGNLSTNPALLVGIYLHRSKELSREIGNRRVNGFE